MNKKIAPGTKITLTSNKVHNIEAFGYKITCDSNGMRVERDTIKLTTQGDYGADPIGDGMFRMVPSGDIVTYDERCKRLAKL